MNPKAAFALVAIAAGVAFYAGTHVAREAPERVELRFLSVGQGDSTLFRADGRTVLIDVGPPASSRGIVVPRLARLGVDHVDLIVITHPDLDHIGGLASVWRRYPRASVVMNQEFREHPVVKEALTEAGKSPDSIMWLQKDWRLAWGGAELRVLLPEPALVDDNRGSLFVHVRHRSSSAVLTGDAPMPVEEAMIPRADFSAQVMSAGHHGSASSGSPAWHEEVDPKWVVASCGRDNRYGHPTVDAKIRAEKSGARFLRTDTMGEIVFIGTESGFMLESGL